MPFAAILWLIQPYLNSFWAETGDKFHYKGYALVLGVDKHTYTRTHTHIHTNTHISARNGFQETRCMHACCWCTSDLKIKINDLRLALNHSFETLKTHIKPENILPY